MKYLYQFEQKYKKELENLLSQDPYAEESFARLGYILKESKAVGLKDGFLILYFKTENTNLAEKLVTQLKTITTGVEIIEDKEKVLKAIEAEEENAASGFGSIFG